VTVLAIFAVGLILGAVVAHTVGLGGVQQYSTVTATSTDIAILPQSTTTLSATMGFESGLPGNFTLGEYTFTLTCQGTCQSVQGGTSSISPGYAVDFNVTDGVDVQQIGFLWAPSGPTDDNPLPAPASETAFDGAVTMSWSTTGAALSDIYLTVKVQA